MTIATAARTAVSLRSLIGIAAASLIAAVPVSIPGAASAKTKAEPPQSLFSRLFHPKAERAKAAHRRHAPAKAARGDAKPRGPTRASLYQQAEEYWNEVAAKRRQRIAKRRNNEPITLDDYVLTQPPPIVRRPPPPPPGAPRVPRVPVLAEFLKMGAQQYGFVPDPPTDEMAFKLAYAKIAIAAGITRDQAVGIYSFETGGNGTYNVQAGLTHPSPRARAISPAIGYNQLLSTNTVGLLAQNGDRYVAALQDKAAHERGEAKAHLEGKIAALKKMIAFCRSVPFSWAEHDKLAKFTYGGIGVHAAVVDRDIGPLLQAQKLIDSVEFIRSKGHQEPLTAAELALMNLTGDGNGLDLVTMPKEMRPKVPTSNFFQEHGYNRNSIARRTAVVSGLFEDIDAKMKRRADQPGARDMAAAFEQAAKAASTTAVPPGSTTAAVIAEPSSAPERGRPGP